MDGRHMTTLTVANDCPSLVSRTISFENSLNIFLSTGKKLFWSIECFTVLFHSPGYFYLLSTSCTIGHFTVFFLTPFAGLHRICPTNGEWSYRRQPLLPA